MSGWERQEFYGHDPKIVAFDFDETISDNEPLWLQVMLALEKGGYHVVVCTWRTPTTYPEDLKFLVDRGFKVYYTSGQAKQDYMAKQGIRVDIWVDDNPFAILNNAK
ncbi:hypothetical protein phiPsa267_104 [Pseudomonas phage phiPsa267]|uniref:3'-phosphatase, 5'-polynucleotide kinase n=1 Tax=Pseudomonas phage phiPsa267 TaxID=1460361 RepID=A0A7G9V103_9CAUD|nr:hypothetical protein QGX19_gp126 [Pseudomonas phage phiPsa267]QNN99958.1 hypothetical protein phiPsa267_104 [Pseudomonas phage phiPsa267]